MMVPVVQTASIINKTSAELVLHVGEFVAVWELYHLPLAKPTKDMLNHFGKNDAREVLLKRADIHRPPFMCLLVIGSNKGHTLQVTP